MTPRIELYATASKNPADNTVAEKTVPAVTAKAAGAGIAAGAGNAVSTVNAADLESIKG